ncbi:MAG: hypothetical protein LAT54_07695 [Cryomorphaceae bacterium]|nr:hypothetical protein [Cryomorphaceae bacterium]
MVKSFIFGLLILIGVGHIEAQSCDDITSDALYFSAKATAESEESARLLAQDYLINQISTTVQSVSALTTTEISGEVTQDYVSTGTNVSSLRLKGLRHMVCSQNRRNNEVTVLVYIAMEDLESSARAVETQVREYFELMAMKEMIGAYSMTDVYFAYLHTFLSPLPISLEHNGRTINDAKTYLEVMLREHLNGLSFDFESITPGHAGMEEQYSISASIANADPGLNYNLHIPSLNARAVFRGGQGMLHVFMRPAAPKETINGYLTFGAGRIPAEVQEVANLRVFSRSMSITLDFSQVISVDFTTELQADHVVATPRLAHVSPRSFSWEMGNQRLSNDQILRVPRENVTGPIRLVINDNQALSVRKTIDGDVVQMNAEAPPESENSLKLSSAHAAHFENLSHFSELQKVLAQLRRGGLAVWGNKTDFVNPNTCWVLLVDPQTEQVQYVLSPHHRGRTDIKSGQTFNEVGEQFKGLIAIWVDFI